MLSSPLVVRIPPSMQMTDAQFFEFCQINRDLRNAINLARYQFRRQARGDRQLQSSSTTLLAAEQDK